MAGCDSFKNPQFEPLSSSVPYRIAQPVFALVRDVRGAAIQSSRKVQRSGFMVQRRKLRMEAAALAEVGA